MTVSTGYSQTVPSVVGLTPDSAKSNLENLGFTEQEVQEAQNQPMEVSRIQKQLSKTGATEFVFEHLEIDLEETPGQGLSCR